MTAADVDYIKLAATQRHIAETVFNRANENGIKLPADTVGVILRISINLAFAAHVPDFQPGKSRQ